MPKRPVEVEWTVAGDERMRAGGAQGHGDRASRARPCGACRGRRPRTRARLLLPVHGRRRAQPRRAHAHAAARGRAGRAAALRRRRLPALRGRLFHRLPAASRPSGSISSSTTATTSTSTACCGPGDRELPVVRVMPGEPDECYTLDDYRHRYALYQLDPDLQAAHASAPFVMSYDDHEVDNDWAGDTTEEYAPPELFLLRARGRLPGLVRTHAGAQGADAARARHPRLPALWRRRPVSMNVLDTRSSARRKPAPRARASSPIARRPSIRSAPCSARRRSAGSTTV